MIEVHSDKQITIHFKYNDQIKRVLAYLEQRGIRLDGKEDVAYGTEKQTAATAGNSAGLVIQ